MSVLAWATRAWYRDLFRTGIIREIKIPSTVKTPKISMRVKAFESLTGCVSPVLDVVGGVVVAVWAKGVQIKAVGVVC